MIDSIEHIDLTKRYTYSDYLTWNFRERVELIKGILYKMSPAPQRIHQKVSIELATMIKNCLKDRKCELYTAPFDVRFIKEDQIKDDNIVTVVQPDLCIICDQSKLDDAGCLGAPNMIVEILSPSSAQKDAKEKFQLYEEHGVQEYWMVHIDEKLIDVFHLENNKYQLDKIYTSSDQIKSAAIQGLIVNVQEVFQGL